MRWLNYPRSRRGAPSMLRPDCHGLWGLPEMHRQLIFAAVGGVCGILFVELLCLLVISFSKDTAVPQGLRAVWQVVGRWF